MGDHARKQTGPAEVQRLRATYSLIVAHSKSKQVQKLKGASGGKWRDNGHEGQRGLGRNKKRGRGNLPHPTPTGRSVRAKTRRDGKHTGRGTRRSGRGDRHPRAGEDAQRSGGQNTEPDTGNWPPTAEVERDEEWVGNGNNIDPTDTVYEAPVITTINKPVAMRMGPPARTNQTRKVPAAPRENKGKQIRFAWEEGLDIIRMYGIIELAKRKGNLQRSPPEGHAQAYREMMRQACDAANRKAKRRKKGQIADDAQDLLARLLLPAPKRTPGNNTKVKTHAEAMQETAQLLLRRDELEANELRTRLVKPQKKPKEQTTKRKEHKKQRRQL